MTRCAGSIRLRPTLCFQMAT